MLTPLDISQEPRTLGALGGRLRRVGVALLVVGGLAAGALGATSGDGGRSFFFGYLLNYAFVLSLALGALCFVMLQHVTHAGWSVVVRRLAEGVAQTMPLMAVLFLPLLLAMPELYRWAAVGGAAGDPVLAGKAAYLNVPFFVARWAVYLLVWIYLARFFFRRSVAQDTSGDPLETVAMQRRAAVGLVVYAFTLTFASFDLLMSLEPDWYSTMFGVYYFSGAMVGVFALLPVMVWVLQRGGVMTRAVTREHSHDMGKLLFAFIVFWAYIAFSQYMLIWYGNIPEETAFFLRRQTGGWGWIGLVLVFGHFFVPFLALLSRTPKRRLGMLAGVAVWVLAMHWVDVYWLVVPQESASLALPLVDLALLVAFSGAFLVWVATVLARVSLIPERDPRLAESLTFENA